MGGTTGTVSSLPEKHIDLPASFLAVRDVVTRSGLWRLPSDLTEDYSGLVAQRSRSDIIQPTIHQTHTHIYNPRRRTSRVMFLCQKVAPFGAAILTINDFFIFIQARSTRTHTHISLSHTTYPMCLCLPTASHQPTNQTLLPHVSNLQSARFSLQSTIPPLFGWLNCLCVLFSARRCRQGGGKIFFFCCFVLLGSIYIHIYTHTHIYTYLHSSCVEPLSGVRSCHARQSK